MPALNDIDVCSSENMNKSLMMSASDESVDQHGREARHIVQCLAEHVVYGWFIIHHMFYELWTYYCQDHYT